MKRVARASVMVAACAAAMTGCRDNGLPDRNLPRDAARQRTYGYAVYQPAADQAPIRAAGHTWLAGLPVQTIPLRLLVPVSGTASAQVYALRGEHAPYGILYTPVSGDQWRPLYRID